MPTSERVPGHTLIREGAPHDHNGNVYWALAGAGRGKCSCGAMSDPLPSGGARQRWHRDHKAEVLPTLTLAERGIPSGISLITTERFRQINTEGFTDAHDDCHFPGDLVKAAEHYAMYASRQLRGATEDLDLGMPAPDHTGSFYGWPWHGDWWKPTEDPLGNLTKAGALIAAEIDRIQRQRAGLVASDQSTPEGS